MAIDTVSAPPLRSAPPQPPASRRTRRRRAHRGTPLRSRLRRPRRPPPETLRRTPLRRTPLRSAPLRPRPQWRSIVAGVLAMLGGLAVWSAGYVLALSPIEHARAQHELYATFRGQLANADAALTGPIAQGTPVALLHVPGAGIGDEVVVEGTTAGDLRAGPGHLPTSPLPGEAGVSVVYGRSLAFGAPFRHVASLRSGAPITVTTDQGVFHYAVTDVRRAGDPLPTQLSAGQGRLVLVTADGGDWQSGGVPDKVVYVDAVLQGKAAPDAGGSPSAVSSAQAPLATQDDPLTLVAIILWLQLLCGVIVVTAWLRSRWQARQVWFVGGAVLVAVLWGLSHTAVQLLPNLI